MKQSIVNFLKYQVYWFNVIYIIGVVLNVCTGSILSTAVWAIGVPLAMFAFYYEIWGNR